MMLDLKSTSIVPAIALRASCSFLDSAGVQNILGTSPERKRTVLKSPAYSLDGRIRPLLACELGIGMTEYAVLLAIIVLGAITAMRGLGGTMHTALQHGASVLGGPPTGVPAVEMPETVRAAPSLVDTAGGHEDNGLARLQLAALPPRDTPPASSRCIAAARRRESALEGILGLQRYIDEQRAWAQRIGRPAPDLSSYEKMIQRHEENLRSAERIIMQECRH